MNRKDCEDTPIQLAAAVPARRFAEACLALALLCAPAAGEVIRVWPSATATGATIMLGDIAELQGFGDRDLQRLRGTVIGDAAAAGKVRTVRLEEVRDQLRAAGINLSTIWLKGAALCTVKTPRHLPLKGRPAGQAQPVLDGTLRSAIRRVFLERLGDHPGALDLRFAPADHAMLDLAEPAYTFEVRLAGSRVLGDVDVEVAVQRGTDTRQVHRLRINATLRIDVVVAGRPIERGHRLRRADLKLARRPFENPAAVGISRLGDVVGQEARRDLRPGEMLRPNDLQPIELVQRNDLIAIHARSSGILIECSARAIERGYLGDVIEVRNEASKQTFHARITGLRQAEVVENRMADATSHSFGGAGK